MSSFSFINNGSRIRIATNAAIKAGRIYSKGISIMELLKRRRNKAILRTILTRAMTTQINKLRGVGIFLPAINRRKRKLINKDGAAIIKAPTNKLTKAPESNDSLRTIEK